MTTAPIRRRVIDGVGFRVAFLLAIVLLPLTVIAVVKSLTVMQEARARSEAALMGETMRAASGELRLIQQARGSATVLSDAIWPIAKNDDECNILMRRILDEEAQYSLIAYVPENGISKCNSAGKVFDFAEDPLFTLASKEPQTSFAVKAVGLVSGASVLAITHPVFDENGTYRGLVSMSLPHSGLRVARDSGTDGNRPLTMITYDAKGTVLTASQQLDDIGIAIPRDRSLAALTGDRAFSFTADSAADLPRTFSVVPLVPNVLYALGSWPPAGGAQTQGVFGSLPVLVPLLMWIASVVVAWLAVERQVIRHVQKLGRSIVSFAGGNRLVGDIDVSGAPTEIREMAEAYEQMTETILHDEAELEDIVHQKEVLLREVHHRVKNNLQLIASIMNMQMRRTKSEEARSIMKGLQDRVMSLATIHRELYQTAGLSDIHTDELLSMIVRQITNMADWPDRRFTVHSTFDDIRLVPDQAVPLALLVSEAVTNALKHAMTGREPSAELWVSLKRTDDSRAELRIRNTTVRPVPGTEETASESSGLGTQLISAFAMQMGGLVRRETEDGFYNLMVSFELRPLSDGEQRSEALERA